ncbi:hypothetical protein ABFX02_09G070600 [Erythranthe guttata]
MMGKRVGVDQVVVLAVVMMLLFSGQASAHDSGDFLNCYGYCLKHDCHIFLKVLCQATCLYKCLTDPPVAAASTTATRAVAPPLPLNHRVSGGEGGGRD